MIFHLNMTPQFKPTGFYFPQLAWTFALLSSEFVLPTGQSHPRLKKRHADGLQARGLVGNEEKKIEDSNENT